MIKQLYTVEFAGQNDIMQAFSFAITNSKLVFVVDKHDSGFHFTLRKFDMIFPDLKYATVSLANDLDDDIAIKMFGDLGSITEATNRNYRTMGRQEFFANLNNGALRGKRILLVFDRFEKLKSEYSLMKFFKLVSQLTVKCGIIVRTDKRQLDRIKARYADIYAHMIQFD